MISLSSMVAICLGLSAVSGSLRVIKTGQPDKSQSTVKSQSPGKDATQPTGMTFKLTIMSNGLTKSGAAFGGYTYVEISADIKVTLEIVHLRSPEAANKEYNDRLKYATKIVEHAKVGDSTGTTEERAVILVPAKKDCKEATEILRTSGKLLRIIESCFPDAALDFEKQAERAGGGDRILWRSE